MTNELVKFVLIVVAEEKVILPQYTENKEIEKVILPQYTENKEIFGEVRTIRGQ